MSLSDLTKHIPEPSLRRLPRYHHLLRALAEREVTEISCSQIGTYLSLDPTQVRKDVALTGIVGKPKVGYEVKSLLKAIEGFLGWDNKKQAFLVGAGNLGQALLTHQQFNKYGLEIAAAFDVDVAKVGLTIEGKTIFPLDKLADLAKRMRVYLGIITVPADRAQAVADKMVEGGIKAIWNFAPTVLDTPDDVLVQNEDLFASLAVLSRRLTTETESEDVEN